ncbi:MAG: glycosyltransferase [Phycisphaerales bacterium]
MRVVQLSSWERSGGAAVCVQRLHRGLRAEGIDDRIIVRSRETDDALVAEVRGDAVAEQLWDTIERYWIVDNRTERSDTFFSTGRPGADVSTHPWVRDADVLHLHWTSGFLASRDIRALGRLGQPIVWTLHDEWPYTGGCHFSAGCDRWRGGCHECPQLRRDPFGLVEAVFADKARDFANAPLSLVAPSRWMADRAEQSAIFAGRRVRVIANAVELDVHHPGRRDAARQRLGLDASCCVILFVAVNRGERRKGLPDLVAALQRVASSSNGAAAIRDGRVRGILIGSASGLELPMPTHDLGLVRDEREVADAMAAADVTVIPSLEDNIPYTVLESIACGTPVLAYAVGGIPEALAAQPADLLVPVGDVAALAHRLLAAIDDVSSVRRLRDAVRADAERRYGSAMQASEYAMLYRSLVARGREEGAANVESSDVRRTTV